MRKLLFLALALGCCLVLNRGATGVSLAVQVAQQGSGLPPPNPAPVPPNASRVTGSVLKYSFWSPGTLQNTTPPLPSDQAFYSLRMEIYTSRPENPELQDLSGPGMVIEAFCSDILTSDLVGKKIEATLKLTGDTRGVRWWIANVRSLQ